MNLDSHLDRDILPGRSGTSVRKHGNHDQSSHGNWARGGSQDEPWPTNHVEALQKAEAVLGKRFKNAKVIVDYTQPASVESLEGMTKGLDAMGEKFPSTADDIVVIVIGPSHMSTATVGETIITGVDQPDGTLKTGMGLMFNTDWFGTSHRSWEQALQADDWFASPGTESPQAHAMSVAIHEFGHAVHLNAVQNKTGATWANEWETGLNEQLFGEIAGQRDFFGHVSSATNYPAQPDVADWGQALDNLVHHGIAADISQYAAWGRAEAFAEGFTTRHSPYGTTSVPKDMADMWEEIEAAAS